MPRGDGATWKGRGQELVGEQLEVLQGDVPHAEELSEQVGRLGGKDVEQGHPAVEASQHSLAAKELPETEQPP